MTGSIITKVTCGDLANAVRSVRALRHERSRIDAYRLLHMEAETDALVVWCTDGDLTVTARIPAESEACGRISLDPQTLVAACAAAETDDTRAVIEADLVAPPVAAIRVGHNTFTLPAFPAEVTRPTVRTDDAVVCDLEAVRSALARTLPFASHSVYRPYLCGVAVHEPVRGKLAFVASDGTSLARVMVPILAGSGALSGEHLIRSYMVNILRKTLKAPRRSNATIRIVEDAPFVHFTVTGSDVVASVRDFDEPYVDYQRVIPTSWICDKTIAMRDIRSAVTAMKAWCAPKTPCLVMTFANGALRIRPETTERTPVEKVIATPGDTVVQEAELLVDPARLLDILERMDANTVRILVSGQEAPLMLRSPEMDDCEYVTMPMRARTAKDARGVPYDARHRVHCVTD
jgi:DNA polymerase III sliding clamp (beta) subunit (PCNA family)